MKPHHSDIHRLRPGRVGGDGDQSCPATSQRLGRMETQLHSKPDPTHLTQDAKAGASARARGSLGFPSQLGHPLLLISRSSQPPTGQGWKSSLLSQSAQRGHSSFCPARAARRLSPCSQHGQGRKPSAAFRHSKHCTNLPGCHQQADLKHKCI